MENGNQPAFPDTRRAAAQTFTNQAPEDLPTGMTKREYFAALALQGWLSSFTNNEAADPYMAATKAVEYADCLLAELSKQ